MVEIGRLLEVNSHYPNLHAFEECLGDRYLYARNPIYKKIRDYALHCGISYCREGSSLWYDYQVCPLFCLNAMLEEKSIPMIDNQSSLARLAEKAGRSFPISGKFLTKVLKRNYLLHESSHYVAYCVINLAAHLVKAPAFASDDEYSVASALLGEAFAATAERLAWALADNPTHVLLFTLNSYMDHRELNHRLVVECLDKFGQPLIGRLGMIALFLNNLKKRPVTDAEFDFILGHFFPQFQNHDAAEQLRQLVSQVFSVAPAFLDETTPAYFRLLGREKEFIRMSVRNYSMNELETLMFEPATSQLLEMLASAGDQILIQMAS